MQACVSLLFNDHKEYNEYLLYKLEHFYIVNSFKTDWNSLSISFPMNDCRKIN